MKRRRFVTSLPTLVSILSAALPAVAGGPERPAISEAVLSQRDFPLLTSLADDKALVGDPVLSGIAASRADSYRGCGDDIACRLAASRFTPAQIDMIAAHLPEGWRGEANAINHIIYVYGEGERSRHDDIDGLAYAADSKGYKALLKTLLDDLDLPEGDASPHADPVFQPALRLALRLLQANGRDEAGRFWPLASGENAPALRRLNAIDWSAFPYSVILVPGQGPDIVGIPLAPEGAERLRLAVAAWREGKAPYILLSGGYVHPARTPFCEAVEMRRYLREVYGIPDDVMLIEPHARHTTTNLRNAARQIFDYGLPSAKAMLVVSDPAQVDNIASDAFFRRNQDELGYQPTVLGKRLSPSRIEAVPQRKSLDGDAFADPLDP